MALGVKAIPFTFVVHVLGIAGLILVLVWTIDFREGLAWEATNKSLIFNILPVLMLVGLIIIGGEATISYKSLPLSKDAKKLVHLVPHAIALILVDIGGFVIFFYPGGTGELRSASIPWHVVFGMVVYVLAVGNASLGFLEKLTFLENSGVANYGSEAFLVNFTSVITILFGAFVVLSVLYIYISNEFIYI